MYKHSALRLYNLLAFFLLRMHEQTGHDHIPTCDLNVLLFLLPGGWAFEQRSPAMTHDVGPPSCSSCDNAATCQHLFAFPAESNFSGARYPLDLVVQVQAQGACKGPPGPWHVLLDAAKACGSSPPDLSRFPADFVVSPILQPVC